MTDNEFMLRAHHGMCLHYFVGKGYSSDFSDNMFKVKSYLEDNNPVVTIVNCVDNVCAACPNNCGGKCTSCGKVESYDNEVLRLCGLNNNCRVTYKEFACLVKDNILDKGLRPSVCADCQWSYLCN